MRATPAGFHQIDDASSATATNASPMHDGSRPGTDLEELGARRSDLAEDISRTRASAETRSMATAEGNAHSNLHEPSSSSAEPTCPVCLGAQTGATP